MEIVREFEILRVNEATVESLNDNMVVEHRLVLYLNGRHFNDFICSPNNLDSLIYGHLFSRGVICHKSDLISCSIGEGRAEAVVKKPFVGVQQSSVSRFHRFTLSSEEVFSAMQTFNSASQLFAATGGVHCCALYSKTDHNIFMEDLGRHNALDKVLGQACLEDLEMSEAFLITSGRVSEVTVKKALHAELPFLISPAAPTAQAVHLARKGNLTLCGFARGRRFNIYSGEGRVAGNLLDPNS